MGCGGRVIRGRGIRVSRGTGGMQRGGTMREVKGKTREKREEREADTWIEKIKRSERKEE